MIIVPVVLASLVCGVASLGDTKKLGRIGIKVILLYLVTTAVALIIALGLASVLQPGLGMDLVAEKAPDIKEAPGFMDVLVGMIPSNPYMSDAANPTFEYDGRFLVKLGALDNTEYKFGKMLSAVSQLTADDAGTLDLSTGDKVVFNPN